MHCYLWNCTCWIGTNCYSLSQVMPFDWSTPSRFGADPLSVCSCSNPPQYYQRQDAWNLTNRQSTWAEIILHRCKGEGRNYRSPSREAPIQSRRSSSNDFIWESRLVLLSIPSYHWDWFVDQLGAHCFQYIIYALFTSSLNFCLDLLAFVFVGLVLYNFWISLHGILTMI